MATTFHRLFLQMLQRGIIHSFTSMKPCHLGSKTDAMLERFKLRLLSNFWCCCSSVPENDHRRQLIKLGVVVIAKPTRVALPCCPS